MKTNNELIFKTWGQRLRNVSWGAIFAGTVVSLAAIFLLNLLGAGIGLTSVNPATEADTMEGLGIGTTIWWVVSNLIALFVGGLVAGRMAGFVNLIDGALHGTISWCLYALLSLYLISAAFGSVVSGIAGAAQNLAGMGQDKVQVDVNRSNDGSDSEKLNLDKAKTEVVQFLKRAEQLDILPEGSVDNVQSIINDGSITPRGVIKSMDIQDYLSEIKIERDAEGNLDIRTGNDQIIDKEGLKTYLAENSEMTEAEIEQTIVRWEQDINEAIDQAREYIREAENQVRHFLEEATDKAGQFMIAAFFALLLGIVAAMAGGALGAHQLDQLLEKEEMYSNPESRDPRI